MYLFFFNTGPPGGRKLVYLFAILGRENRVPIVKVHLFTNHDFVLTSNKNLGFIKLSLHCRKICADDQRKQVYPAGSTVSWALLGFVLSVSKQ